ncbi:hypothetical protein RI367_004059 [Sorochytrium milnesiophthora]
MDIALAKKPISLTSESHLREQLERLSKDTKAMRFKMDTLEKENAALKKSIFDLSLRYNQVAVLNKVSPRALSLNDDDVAAVQPNRPSSAFAFDGAFSSALDQSLYDDYALATGPRDKHRDGKYFVHKADLKGHTGAVYTVQFSNCGKFVATGSFDKTIRIWDPTSAQREVHTLKRHTLNVSDLAWGNDSTELLSGAYDQTCKLWDTDTGKLTASFDVEGFVQCVQYSVSDNNIFFSGSSRNVLCLTDRRRPDSALMIRNDSMVNALYVYRDGSYVLSGDSGGQLKLWDVRTGKCVETVLNEQTRKPISHIAMSKCEDEEEPRYFGVNSYDNVVRVYDRGFNPPTSQTKMIHALKGHKNKNWPIKSAFYHGKDLPLSSIRRTMSHEDVGDSLDSESEVSSARLLDSCMIFATGSADPFTYMFAVGGADGPAEMIQRLDGHTDRVYDVAFHPFEPLLATCSADGNIKLWSWSGKVKKALPVM